MRWGGPAAPRPVRERPPYDLLHLMEQALEGIVGCYVCGERLEPDYDRCPVCGAANPLVAEGLI